MKSIRSLLFVLSAISAVSVLSAAETKKVAGPNGGRIIATAVPRAEFFVTADRKVQSTFLDLAGKPIAPAEQVVTVTTGDRAAPTKLTFTKTATALVSTAPLPAGDDLPTVVQIKSTPTTPTVTAKFNLDLDLCSECKLAEYACTCAH
jgi:DTW domain-containing protein YfiP